MSYIGKQPVVGNFQVCDAITVVNGQAAYTMQVSSANVEPENANHMLVSLNGILQKPGSSFTISGATITFASNLATGDVIDFIILLGNVLDIGAPSDGTVTNAKLSGDLISGETDIGGAIADADLFLLDDGAGGTLRKTAASRLKTYIGSGLGGYDQWRLSATITGDENPITSNLERVDNPTGYGLIGSAMTESSGVFTFPSTGYWEIDCRIKFYANAGSGSANFYIYTTTNNSTYATASLTAEGVDFAGGSGTFVGQHVLDVTDTANCKVKFQIDQSNTGNMIQGHTDYTMTSFTFKKLGDT